MLSGYPIIAYFERTPWSAITINKLAQTLQKSYGWAHKECKVLIKDDVLQATEVGHSILCSLNFTSNKTIGLLALASIERTASYLHDRLDLQVKLRPVLDQTSKHALCILLSPSHDVIVVAADHHLTHIAAGMTVATVDRQTFDAHAHIDHHLLFGFESFWRMAGEKK